MSNAVIIDVPEDFNFRSTVYGHGWHDLAPFELDVEKWRLSYVFRGSSQIGVSAIVSEEAGKLKIELSGSSFDADSIAAQTRHLLRIDDDLSGFYKAIDGHDHLNWVFERRAGRLLRSETVFEDLVKTLCTTNCSWSLTKSMVSNLVDKLGTPSENGKKAFPTAEAMAGVDEDFYRKEMRAGYRSPYFVELAHAVAEDKLNPEKWLGSDLATAELKKEMKKVKGVGDYAAENLLKLVGRYDGLALDSWLRSQFYKKYNGEKACDDKKIERHYARFGQWRGLVIWCDMTQRWLT